MSDNKKMITVKIKRYNPERDSKPNFSSYEVPFREDMVVLDALNYIKDHQDGSLTFRWSCRMGICGSCGALINGTPKLTCSSFLKQLGTSVVRVEPLSYFPIIKDLVVDIDDFMHKLQRIRPWIIRRDEKSLDEGEYLQTPEEMELYHQSSMCINCMLCYAACPVYGLDNHFIGPAASALAYRYIMDSRDQGKLERLSTVTQKGGIWDCSFVGECSAVCPKSVDPAFAIQRLKIMGAFEALKSIIMPGQK